MPLYFNSILEQLNIESEDVRLIRHKDKRADKGRNPFELWLYEAESSLKCERKIEERLFRSPVA